MNKIKSNFKSELKTKTKISSSLDEFLDEKERKRFLTILNNPICRFNKAFI